MHVNKNNRKIAITILLFALMACFILWNDISDLNYTSVSGILALTIKVKDIFGNETEIGQVSFSNYQKGIHTFDIPCNYVNGTISEVILMINSNPYQLDLNKDANCKVEILETSLYK